jgi:hypothetical protein
MILGTAADGSPHRGCRRRTPRLCAWPPLVLTTLLPAHHHFDEIRTGTPRTPVRRGPPSSRRCARRAGDRCNRAGRAQIRRWPAKCTCPPLQPPASSMTVIRRATSTGEGAWWTYAKSCLTPEPLRTLRSETKGQAAACPDRTQAIPCKLRGRLLPMACAELTATVTATAATYY